MKLSEYYRVNKKALCSNWRNNQEIRQKYHFSMLEYINAHVQRIEDMPFIENDISIADIAKDLYRTI